MNDDTHDSLSTSKPLAVGCCTVSECRLQAQTRTEQNTTHHDPAPPTKHAGLSTMGRLYGPEKRDTLPQADNIQHVPRGNIHREGCIRTGVHRHKGATPRGVVEQEKVVAWGHCVCFTTPLGLPGTYGTGRGRGNCSSTTRSGLTRAQSMANPQPPTSRVPAHTQSVVAMASHIALRPLRLRMFAWILATCSLRAIILSVLQRNARKAIRQWIRGEEI